MANEPMTNDILQKFERLRSLRDERAAAKPGWTMRNVARSNEIDTLASKLEEWARGAEAGVVLDRVCNAWRYPVPEWLIDASLTPDHPSHQPSRNPAAAMGLLEAMQAVDWASIYDDVCAELILTRRPAGRKAVGVLEGYGKIHAWLGAADDNCHAIARACAVLSARGIERQGVCDG